ncbi:hypothetical protein Pcinc_003070 [Petrolisthes cinctipes]|uniref:Regulatory protein zeste n=1 Tax=Petrolisthes cinctipes TaxID=88211 RepID=A0AAE1L2U0_PETCI|nr:hypothetical protein Pcinc_003070 [Petrolisthes cinctipes]
MAYILAEIASFEYPTPTKKKKQATFTEDELVVMVTEVAERKQVIFPACSEIITRRLKDTVWREVMAAVNRVSRAGRRSEQDVRKKFRDYRSSLKNKIAKHRSEVKKSGGGPEVKLLLKPSEEALLNLGLLEREAIEGLSDFPDSEDPDLSVLGTCRHDTVWETEEVPNEAEVVLPYIDIPPSPVYTLTDDHHYAARDNRQEFSSHNPSNSASHPSSRPVTPSSSRLANHQILVEIQYAMLLLLYGALLQVSALWWIISLRSEQHRETLAWVSP